MFVDGLVKNGCFRIQLVKLHFFRKEVADTTPATNPATAHHKDAFDMISFNSKIPF